MRRILSLILLLCFSTLAQDITTSNRPVHTFSIVARDPDTGEMGVAVQSHWFSVGAIVSWAEAGVGAIATQSMVNASFGPRGLELLKSGKSAAEVLQLLLADDEGRELRQVAIVDARGRVAAHTGVRCIPAAGHIMGDQFSVQANMMLRETVWPAMAHSMQTSQGPLAERLVMALEAAQAEKGDIRGQQSAALLIVRPASTGKVWEDRLIDLRIEDHPQPIQELKRLLQLHRAYDFMNRGDLAMERNDVDGALEYYGSAQKLNPANLEMRYWTAISLANAGRIAESLAIFRQIFAEDENWLLLTKRLPGVGLLTIPPQDLQAILQTQ